MCTVGMCTHMNTNAHTWVHMHPLRPHTFRTEDAVYLMVGNVQVFTVLKWRWVSFRE